VWLEEEQGTEGCDRRFLYHAAAEEWMGVRLWGHHAAEEDVGEGGLATGKTRDRWRQVAVSVARVHYRLK
jgi:hypothetical protein